MTAIKLKCRCGAEFEMNDEATHIVVGNADSWLNRHAACPHGGQGAPTPNSPWPSTPGYPLPMMDVPFKVTCGDAA